MVKTAGRVRRILKLSLGGLIGVAVTAHTLGNMSAMSSAALLCVTIPLFVGGLILLITETQRIRESTIKAET